MAIYTEIVHSGRRCICFRFHSSCAYVIYVLDYIRINLRYVTFFEVASFSLQKHEEEEEKQQQQQQRQSVVCVEFIHLTTKYAPKVCHFICSTAVIFIDECYCTDCILESIK